MLFVKFKFTHLDCVDAHQRRVFGVTLPVRVAMIVDVSMVVSMMI